MPCTLAGWRFRQSINGLSPYLQVVHKGSEALRSAYGRRGVQQRGQAALDLLRPGLPFHLNLKPFSLGAPLKQAEILVDQRGDVQKTGVGSTHATGLRAPILRATKSVKGNPMGRVRSNVFHRHKQGHARVSTAQCSQLNL